LGKREKEPNQPKKTIIREKEQPYRKKIRQVVSRLAGTRGILEMGILAQTRPLGESWSQIKTQLARKENPPAGAPRWVTSWKVKIRFCWRQKAKMTKPMSQGTEKLIPQPSAEHWDHFSVTYYGQQQAGGADKKSLKSRHGCWGA